LDEDSIPRPPACEASMLNLTPWYARKMKWILSKFKTPYGEQDDKKLQKSVVI
jgi:hypothetical protein